MEEVDIRNLKFRGATRADSSSATGTIYKVKEELNGRVKHLSEAG